MSWWLARSARERMLLSVMLALFALLLAWLAVVRPLADSLDAAKRRHGEAVVALAQARVRTGPVDGPAVIGPVDALVSQTAAAAGFTNVRVGSQGPARASAALDAARPQALFGWVGEMERRGLIVEQLHARANPDRTLSAEIVLRARRR
jgi:general secretion pathway protein M